MTKEELLVEEHICNGKCQDDITKNYIHCKTCTRLNDFLAGYRAGKVELGKQIADLNVQLSGVCDCFIGASSGDDFEMAESAREVMEVLNIHCYRHGEVKSNLTKAKDLIENIIRVTWGEGWNYSLDWKVKAEQFLKEIEK